MKKIFIAGDSIMANYDITQYPMTGIGMALSLYIRNEIKIYNYAIGGRSTKSYIDQGFLKKIENEIGCNDFFFIKFGHNDEKINAKEHYTTPFGTYQENLKKMVAVAKQVGAIPVLMSSLERRWFKDASNAWNDPSVDPRTPYMLIPSAHTDYAEAARQVAEEEGVGFIDLLAKSRDLLEKAGPVQTAGWYMNVGKGKYPAYPEGMLDNTHLNNLGAAVFAGLIAEGLRELGGIYEQLLTDRIREQNIITPIMEN